MTMETTVNARRQDCTATDGHRPRARCQGKIPPPQIYILEALIAKGSNNAKVGASNGIGGNPEIRAQHDNQSMG
jgi:hypothetical protein